MIRLLVLAALAATAPTFDASTLKQGKFTYRMSIDGKPIGDTVIEVRRKGGDYHITMNAPEISQQWQATMRQGFEPIAAHLRMQGKKGAYEMNLHYAGDQVAGEERSGAETRVVQATTSGVVVDQRVDWAAMMAATGWKTGPIELHVYDPGTGLSRMVGNRAEENGQLRLDYQIFKGEDVESYTVFASLATPRYMIRENMPHGLVAELIKTEP